MIHKIIKLFNGAPADKQSVDHKKMNALSIPKGWMIPKELCYKEVADWVDQIAVDFNSTFYRNWRAITSKTRFELFIDQILHYQSTYGTDYTGTPYIPNKGETAVDLSITVKNLTVLSKQEIVDRCSDLLYSGIALSQETITDVLDILKYLSASVEISKVKNREALMFLHKSLGTAPEEPVEMVRFLVYLATDKSLLIKDKATIDAIKASKISLRDMRLNEAALSSVFYRFKPLFLAMRTSDSNRVIINRLRRLAVDNHLPMKAGFFETLLEKHATYSDEQIVKALETANNFKKVKLLQAILIRGKELACKTYLVRNNKVWIEDGTTKPFDNTRLYALIYASLVAGVSKNACKVKLPKFVKLAVPSSEKSFIGNYPLNTSFMFENSGKTIGIYWEGEKGARDLDLKLHDISETLYGWNANYKANGVVFSGDQTSANPSACEYFYTSKKFNPSLLKVNIYNGTVGCEYKLVIAKGKSQGNMITPENYITSIDVKSLSKEETLGVLLEDRFVLAKFRTGNSKVSRVSVTDKYTDYALRTLDCTLFMDELLRDAGFELSDDGLDLTNPTKDDLIRLLS